MTSVITIQFIKSEIYKQMCHKHKFIKPLICPPPKNIIPLYFPSSDHPLYFPLSDQSTYPIYCDKNNTDYEYLFINKCI